MVDLGVLRPITCPSGAACPHDIELHRYESDRERWVCTDGECRDNPYRVIKVSDLSARALLAAGYADMRANIHALHGPEVTIEFTDEPYPGDEQPEAEIQQVGRWTYRVSVSHGLLTYGPDGYGWHILGRRRAERKAERALARYIRKQAREAEVVVVEPREAE